jgi:hypothetical protein
MKMIYVTLQGLDLVLWRPWPVEHCRHESQDFWAPCKGRNGWLVCGFNWGCVSVWQWGWQCCDGTCLECQCQCQLGVHHQHCCTIQNQLQLQGQLLHFAV